MTNNLAAMDDEGKLTRNIDIGDIDLYFDHYINFLKIIRAERGQLYAIIITLMQDLGKGDGDSITIGNRTNLDYIGENYHASCHANEKGDLVVTLHYHGEKKDEQN